MLALCIAGSCQTGFLDAHPTSGVLGDFLEPFEGWGHDWVLRRGVTRAVKYAD